MTEREIISRPGDATGTGGPGGAGAAAPPGMDQSEALRLGYISGASANFGDEIYGLSKASGLPDWMGGFRAPVGAARMLYETGGGFSPPKPGAERTPFMSNYEEALAQRRGELKQAEKEHPGTFMGGQVLGGVLAPGGAAAAPATVPMRMLRGAAVGGAYGGAAGLGEGENDIDRLTRGAIGAPIGMAVGGLAPPLVEAAAVGGRAALGPVVSAVRGTFNAPGEARRVVGETIGAATAADRAARGRLTPGEVAADIARGGESRMVDLGGEPAQRLARAVKNVTPEGEVVLKNALEPRFETQGIRVADELRGMFQYPNTFQQREGLRAAGRASNNPLYDRAYTAGAGHIGSPELERLAGTKEVQAAMRAAMDESGARNVLAGYGAMNPRVTVTPDGRIVFNRQPSGMPAYPDLQFWDLTRRKLSDKADEAGRAGRRSEADIYGQLADRMNAQLDAAVPEYQAARQSAAHFFGARDASEAGEAFFGSGRRFGTEETRNALAQMNPLERQLFRDAYTDRLIRSVEAPRARQNITAAVPHFGGSPALESEMGVALGRPGLDAMRGIRRREDIMDRSRAAVTGNSTTAQQLFDSGVIGRGILYGGAAGGLGYGTYNADPAQLAAAGLTGALAVGSRRANQNVARHIVEILTSRDPAALTGGAAITQNPVAIRNAITEAMAMARDRARAGEANAALRRSILERGAVVGAGGAIQ
jgi:hypothetical protein